MMQEVNDDVTGRHAIRPHVRVDGSQNLEDEEWGPGQEEDGGDQGEHAHALHHALPVVGAVCAGLLTATAGLTIQTTLVQSRNVFIKRHCLYTKLPSNSVRKLKNKQKHDVADWQVSQIKRARFRHKGFQKSYRRLIV